jgi:hypothetical protein
VILAGLALLVIYADLPIVRNSLVYGNIILNIQEMGDSFSSIDDGYNKPLGFAFLALPFVEWMGINSGLKVLSFIIATLWTLSLLPFFDRFSRQFGVKPDKKLLFLILVTLNPLVIYQFVSAYADLLFALSFLWSVYFLDRTVSKDIKWFDGVALALLFTFSVWVKHNGFILIPITLIVLAFRWKLFRGLLKSRTKEALIAIIGFFAFLTVILLAQAGIDFNLFNLAQNQSNYTSGDNRLSILGFNLFNLLLYLLVSFSIVFPLIFLFRKDHSRLWITVIIIFMLSLLFYRGTAYNLRYYLTIAPFFALLIVSNLETVKAGIRTSLIATHTVLMVFLTAYYNSIPFNSFAKELIPLPNQDNLRLVAEQKLARNQFKEIRSAVEQLAIGDLIFVSGYYNDGSWRVWEESGLFPNSLEIEYTKRFSLTNCDEHPNTLIFYRNGSSGEYELATSAERLYEGVYVCKSN